MARAKHARLRNAVQSTGSSIKYKAQRIARPMCSCSGFKYIIPSGYEHTAQEPNTAEHGIVPVEDQEQISGLLWAVLDAVEITGDSDGIETSFFSANREEGETAGNGTPQPPLRRPVLRQWRLSPSVASILEVEKWGP